MQFELWYTPDRWSQTFHIYNIKYYNNPDTQNTTLLYLITNEMF